MRDSKKLVIRILAGILALIMLAGVAYSAFATEAEPLPDAPIGVVVDEFDENSPNNSGITAVIALDDSLYPKLEEEQSSNEAGITDKYIEFDIKLDNSEWYSVWKENNKTEDPTIITEILSENDLLYLNAKIVDLSASTLLEDSNTCYLEKIIKKESIKENFQVEENGKIFNTYEMKDFWCFDVEGHTIYVRYRYVSNEKGSWSEIYEWTGNNSETSPNITELDAPEIISASKVYTSETSVDETSENADTAILIRMNIPGKIKEEAEKFAANMEYPFSIEFRYKENGKWIETKAAFWQDIREEKMLYASGVKISSSTKTPVQVRISYTPSDGSEIIYSQWSKSVIADSIEKKTSLWIMLAILLGASALVGTGLAFALRDGKEKKIR